MADRTNQELMALRQEHVPAGPFNITPIFARRAKGAVIEDVEGREYIDFAGGIGVENVGHCAEQVVDAIKEQAEQFIHTCFHVVMYEPYIELAQRLNEITPGDFPKKTMFVNSGAEAVENAVKIARYATKRPAIIAFQNAFHGRTYMAMTLTSQVKPYKWGFGPFCPEVYRMPYPYCYRCPLQSDPSRCGWMCLEFMDEVVRANSAGSLAGLLVEPYLGAAGFIFPPDGWLKRLEEWARRQDMLFALDEVQSSYGRTGKMWALEWDSLEPDLLCIGKGIGSGIPVSCLCARSEVMDALGVGEMSSTAGGNPVASAAVLAVIEIMERENLVANAERIGRMMKDRLLEIQERSRVLGDVRGKGLVMGLELVHDKKTKEPAPDLTRQVIDRCAENGLLVGAVGVLGNVIRVAPPLVISETEAGQSLDIMEKVLTSF